MRVLGQRQTMRFNVARQSFGKVRGSRVTVAEVRVSATPRHDKRNRRASSDAYHMCFFLYNPPKK